MEKLEPLLQLLSVYQSEKKTHLGVKGDGGYVIAELDNAGYDCYISAGVSQEESFSRDFINRFGMSKENSFAFDGSINDYPWGYTNRITFYPLFVNAFNNDTNTNLSFITDRYKDIFMKMDIEAGEYAWLNMTSINTLARFKQLVIEFHGVWDDNWGGNGEVKVPFQTKLDCLKKLNETHYLIHIHGNNCDQVLSGIPNVPELTFVRKDCFEYKPALNKTKLPVLGLDYPNDTGKEDFPLNFPPFCQI